MSQVYDTHGDQEYIIKGNAGVLKCKIPSFVADYLDIISWHDSDGTVYSQDSKNYGEQLFLFSNYVQNKIRTLGHDWKGSNAIEKDFR